MNKEYILKEVMKNGKCPDCDKKIDKCNCSFKELFITLKRSDLNKSIFTAFKRTPEEFKNKIKYVQSGTDKGALIKHFS